MAESADRASRFQELSKRYLAPLENEKGTLEFEGHKLAEAADNMLTEVQGYIGVAPLGSFVRGHRVESSDADLVVFMDNSLFESKIDSSLFRASLQQKLQTKQKLKEVHCLIGLLDEEIVRGTIFTALRGDIGDISKKAFWLNIFSPTVIGPKIEEYRSMIRREIMVLSDETQERLVNEFAYALVDAEKESEPKIKKRIPNIKDIEMSALSAAREKKWEEQIKQALRLRI